MLTALTSIVCYKCTFASTQLLASGYVQGGVSARYGVKVDNRLEECGPLLGNQDQFAPNIPIKEANFTSQHE